MLIVLVYTIFTHEIFMKISQFIRRASALMVCGVLLPCASTSAIDSRTEHQAESADQLLRSVLVSDGGPGIMATVIKDGEVIWRGAGGTFRELLRRRRIVAR